MRLPPRFRRVSRTGLSLRLALFGAILLVIFFFVMPGNRPMGGSQVFTWLPGIAFDHWVSNTYEIRQDPWDPGRIWFATEQGVRRHDTRAQTWQVFGLQDGLPCEQVSSIDFDARAVWLGTWRGLVRYDRAAARFDTVLGENAILYQRILDLVVDEKYVYMAVFGSGIYAYDKRTGVTRRFGTAEGLGSKYVYCLAAAGGRVYAGQDSGLVSIGDAETGWRTLRFPGARRVSRTTIIWDLLPASDTLWAATSDAGIWRYRFTTGAWTQIGPLADGFEAQGAYALAASRNAIFAGTSLGLFRLDRAAGMWLRVPEEDRDQPFRQVTALEMGMDPGAKSLWYGAAGRGVGLVGADQVVWYEYPAGVARSGAVALESAGGQVWLGYGYRGGYLDLMDTGFLHLHNYNLWERQIIENVNLVQQAGGLLFIGGYNGFGRGRMGPSGADWKLFTRTGRDLISDVNAVAALGNRMVVGTGSRLLEYDPSRDTVSGDSSLTGAYFSTLASYGNYLYAGTLGGGVHVYADRGGKLAWLGTAGGDTLDLVTSQVEADTGDLWFGTRNQGIWVWPGGAREPGNYAIKPLDFGPLRRRYITCLARVGGELWVGTRGHGVFIRDARGAWKVLGEENYLQNDWINTIKSDHRFVWIGDALGVCRIRRDSLPGILAKAKAP